MNRTEMLESAVADQLKSDDQLGTANVGDTIDVHYLIVEVGHQLHQQAYGAGQLEQQGGRAGWSGALHGPTHCLTLHWHTPMIIDLKSRYNAVQLNKLTFCPRLCYASLPN